MSSTDYGSIIGGFLVIFAVVWLICLAIAIVHIIGVWKTFNKAGLNGWAAIIPFYNMYTMCKMTWGSGWYFLLFMIPFGGMIFMIVTYVKVAKVFGKSGGFAVGLIFLSPIFFMILGCGDAQYQGPDIEGKGKTGAIVATVIAGLLWLIILVVGMVAGLVTAISTSGGDTIIDYEKDPGSGNEIIDTEIYEGDKGYLPSDTKDVTLSNSYTSILIPIWDGEYTYSYGTTASAEKSGVSVDLSLGYSELGGEYGTTLDEALEEEMGILESVYSSSSDYISDVVKDEKLSGDGWVLQQINYNYNIMNEVYPSFDIVKVDDCNGYPLVITISVNNSMADEGTEDALLEACDMYGVEFELE